VEVYNSETRTLLYNEKLVKFGMKWWRVLYKSWVMETIFSWMDEWIDGYGPLINHVNRVISKEEHMETIANFVNGNKMWK
jgi:hypothetical protein